MKPFLRRFPWITTALAALYAAAWFLPAGVLEYDRPRVAAGEVWRLLTGQMIHWTARMAFFDVGMLLGLGIWLEIRGDRRLMAVTLALGGCLTALAVNALSPGLQVYRGSSGLASALFVLAAVRIAGSADPRSRILATAAVTLFLAKATFESLTGQTLFAGPLPQGVHVVPLVHLLGGLGGALAFSLFSRLGGGRWEKRAGVMRGRRLGHVLASTSLFHPEKGVPSMNKKARKLVLSRETLQKLTDPALRQVNGGDTDFCSGVSGCLECPPPSYLPPC